MSNDKIKKQKIFLNAMDSWFSNFIIEFFRTDHMPESKNQTEFMGTLNSPEDIHLPLHFVPSIYKFDFNPSYKNELFSNDVIIYDLNTGNLKEAEYIINGLKTLKLDSEKIVIFISNIMTWAKTPNKYKTESEDEIVFVHPEKEDKKLDNKKDKENESIKRENSFISNLKEQSKLYEQSFNNSIMGGTNQSKLSIKQLQNRSKLSKLKEEKEENKIIVYYTEKDYLKRKPSLKYFEFKYIENEAINLNQKTNIKSYVICPGIVYGYGEKHFYSFFRSALLGLPIEEILLDKGRNIIPTIHMKDLVNIISKVIEKKPASNYILAFDQTKNSSLKNIVKMIYNCIGDEKKMIEKKESLNNNEENNNENNENENEENKDIIVKEEKDENEDSIKKEPNEEGNLNEENPENKQEENKPSIHPFFLNKKYQISEFFPRDLLYLDVKILPSDFIKFESQDKDKEQKKLSTPLFKWHCPYGIISNPVAIKKEFLKYRNLLSNKILILGNPYTGKTTISQILSKIFHLPIIDIKSVVDFGKSFAGVKLNEDQEEEKKENEKEKENQEPIKENNNELNNNNETNENKENKEKEENIRKSSLDNDLIQEIVTEINKLKEKRAEAEEAYNKRPNKKKTDPPFDDNMYFRFSDELISKILKRRLEENDSSTYGFILDGIPKNYNQLFSLFNEGEKSIAFPNTILLFEDIEDDVCLTRIKNSEEVLKDPKDPKVNILLERANRRLGKLKEDKTKEDYKTIKDYFDEDDNKRLFKDKLMIIDGKNNSILDIIKLSQEFIIKNNGNKINAIDEGLYCNDYLYDYVKIEEEKNKPKEEETELNKDEKKEEEKDKDKDKDKEKETINENKEEINKENVDKEKEKEENKEENKEIEEKKEEPKIKSKLELEKENEFKLLEKKSEVLRRYLAENVLPLLSLGILHVANERPDDPVEALADYLLAKTFEIKKNEEENNNEENIKENEKEEENKSIDLNLNEEKKSDEIKLQLDTEENIVDKKEVGRLSPIHRENSEHFNIENIEKNENEENYENKEEEEPEDELNKAMIDSH